MLANQLNLTDKVVSERHYEASQTKLTAGESAKILSKKLGIKISAKELVTGYRALYDNPEWHHSGFYKGSNGSRMGKTYFFTNEQIENLARDWNKISDL